jgi:hypothetical protein
MRYFPLLAVSVAIFASWPAAAHGQEFKRPDPNSPAGVEYQLPLDQARQNAAAGSKGRSSGHRALSQPGAAPLFGAGIATRHSAARSGEGAGRAAQAAGGRAGSTSGGAAARAGGDDAAKGDAGGANAVSKSSLGASDSGPATLRIAGIALAVLLAGGLLGLGLRHGLRTDS